MKTAIRLLESQKYKAELDLFSTHSFPLAGAESALAALASRQDSDMVHVCVTP
jgi:threonine dehydrogenase-like Zn-dependent dehydrogenase